MGERNIKAVIAYDGTDYFGWQIQPGLPTVQGVIEEALANLLGEDSRLNAAGRTDRGVHATGQAVNFFTRRRIPLVNLKLALNVALPRDIFIREVSEVNPGFHARFSAKERTYRYHLGLWGEGRSPFFSRYCWYPERPLDFRAMAQSTEYLVGKHDHRAFTVRSEIGEKHTLCEIRAASWEKTPSGYSLVMMADRFLPQMVRRILAMLIDIGTQKYHPSVFHDILTRGKEAWSKPWAAPPHGLFLQHVGY